MLSELLTWFWGRRDSRRRYPRRTGGFRAWFATDSGWTQVHTVDISPGGMGLVSEKPLEGDELNFRLQVESKSIPVRARQVWRACGTLAGAPAWRYGFAYTGIGADDWDALVRFCSSEPVVQENKAQKELELVRMQADDVARLVPQRLQERLLSMLVEARRLAPIEKDKIPLVQYFYGGMVKRGSRHFHRLSIHSRVVDDAQGDARTYDTRFTFDESGNEIEMEKR